MFEAALIICVLTASGPVDPCVELKDIKGPYRTEKECHTRLEEMKMDIKEDPLYMYYIFEVLQFPTLTASLNVCEHDGSINL